MINKPKMKLMSQSNISSNKSSNKSATNSVAQSSLWKTLEQHSGEISQLHMRDMFAEDPERFEKFSLKLNDILFDYSKNIITSETMENLYRLADECKVTEWIANESRKCCKSCR